MNFTFGLILTLTMTLTAAAARSPCLLNKTESSTDILMNIPPLLSPQESHHPVGYPISLVLTDFENLLPDEFSIPQGLYMRTAFWLNVYSRFSSDYRLLHHQKFPWIVYRVIGIEDLKNQRLRGWQKVQVLRDRAQRAKKDIQNALRSLSKKKSFKKLSGFEKTLYEKLRNLPGKKQDVFRTAAKNVRDQLGQRDFFRSGIINSRRYLPAMEKIFKSYGLPTELTRLPLVESSFNETAVSKAGASGVWQIMPSIGRQFVNVGHITDERNSPIKATHIAAKLLRENYERFASWPLAVTSYNHGPGGVARGVREVGSKKLIQLILNYRGPSFGFASSNFYAEFLAALYAEKYQKYLYGELPQPEALSYELLKLSDLKGHSLKEIAVLSQLSLEDLMAFNLDLKKNVREKKHLPQNYELIIPQENAQILNNNLHFLKESTGESITN